MPLYNAESIERRSFFSKKINCFAVVAGFSFLNNSSLDSIDRPEIHLMSEATFNKARYAFANFFFYFFFFFFFFVSFFFFFLFFFVLSLLSVLRCNGGQIDFLAAAFMRPRYGNLKGSVSNREEMGLFEKKKKKERRELLGQSQGRGNGQQADRAGLHISIPSMGAQSVDLSLRRGIQCFVCFFFFFFFFLFFSLFLF
jgi:hypothetical protein